MLKQSDLDSIIESKNTTIIKGVIPTYAAPGCEDIARQRQSIMIEAIKYYSAKYEGVDIKAKFAVLDKTNWTSEVYPYGYMYGWAGWIVMPGDIGLNDFIKIYGGLSMKPFLLEEASKQGINLMEMPESNFEFFAVHELGHLIVYQMIDEHPLKNIFLHEMAANVVAYEFLNNNYPEKLRRWKLFFEVVLKNYVPYFTTMNELYDNFGEMSVDNYVWYHSNFTKLVEEIYNKKDKDFLICLKRHHHENNIMDKEIKETVKLLDKDYDGIFTKWLENFDNSYTQSS